MCETKDANPTVVLEYVIAVKWHYVIMKIPLFWNSAWLCVSYFVKNEWYRTVYLHIVHLCKLLWDSQDEQRKGRSMHTWYRRVDPIIGFWIVSRNGDIHLYQTKLSLHLGKNMIPKLDLWHFPKKNLNRKLNKRKEDFQIKHIHLAH